MEPTDGVPVQTESVINTKRPNFFQRLRRSFTLVFRRRNNRKTNKSESQIPEKIEECPKTAEEIDLSSTLPNDQNPEITSDPEEAGDSIKPVEANFRPAAKVPLFINDFTSELKQSLKLRSRKIEEGEKSPTEVIKQIENLRTLSSISYEEKPDVKIEIESKTFEEKLALFESQISGGSESLHDTLKGVKSGDQREGNDDDDIECPPMESVDIGLDSDRRVEEDVCNGGTDSGRDSVNGEMEAPAVTITNGDLSHLDSDGRKSPLCSDTDGPMAELIDTCDGNMKGSLGGERLSESLNTDNTTADMQ